MTDTTELAALPRSALPTILAADTNDILGKLRYKVLAHKPDISTVAGRKEIASLAHEVASSKMDLIRLGKSLTEGWRKQTAAVNAECKTIEEKMDALKEQVRAPLTAFENAEKARVKAHEDALAAIEAAPDYYYSGKTSADLAERLEHLEHYPYRDWQEFSQRAADTLAMEIDTCRVALNRAHRAEAESAELERLRAEQAERDRLAAIQRQQEREARIALEAAEQARQEAEEARLQALAAARAEQERVERLAREADARAAEAEADRLAAIEAGRIAAENAERRQREAADAAARREVDLALAAQQREAEAVERERQRQAAEAKRIADEAAAREANRAHKSKIMREAKESLIEAGLSEEMAVIAVKAIVAGQIKHVRVEW
jgi:hypothetical protein